MVSGHVDLSLSLCWQVASQYLVLQRTHRGALWARGAAQAAQVVRIMMAWLGRRKIENLFCHFVFFGAITPNAYKPTADKNDPHNLRRLRRPAGPRRAAMRAV